MRYLIAFIVLIRHLVNRQERGKRRKGGKESEVSHSLASCDPESDTKVTKYDRWSSLESSTALFDGISTLI